MNTKYVYTFGDGKAEGKADMRNLLGGKGANLAEMNLIGLPVPAGFTITTEVCTIYNQQGKDAVVKLIENDVKAGIAHMEHIMNAKFGSKGEAFPLMVSVRSGARVSMPGMMDTVLNLGLMTTPYSSWLKSQGMRALHGILTAVSSKCTET